MKKLLIMLLALCTVLSMAACGGDADKDAASKEISEESVTVTELPDVKGMTVDEALSAVEEAGYTNVKTVLCHKEGSTKDTVVAQSKTPGAVYDANGMIVLQVSNGLTALFSSCWGKMWLF